MMKKVLSLIFSAMFVVLTLSGCSDNHHNSGDSGDSGDSGNSSNSSQSEVTMTCAEIEAKIKEALGEDGYLLADDSDTDMIMNRLQLDPAKVLDSVLKESPSSAIAMDFVAIVKVEDGYQDTAVENINAYYQQIVSYVDQYAFDVAKVQNARLYRNGQYIALFIAGQAADPEASDEDAAKLAVSEYEKIDSVWKEIFGSAENIARQA